MTAPQQASAIWEASAAAGASSPAALTLTDTLAHGGVDPLRVGLALAVCLALGVAAIFFLRRRLLAQGGAGLGAARTSAKRLAVVETTRLNARATLYLVDYDGRTVLLVADAGGVKPLDAQSKTLLEPAA